MLLKRINKLSNSLINKISAGEIIERPSSGLKEVMENSIDAKSKKIIVELINGGSDQIKVIDDGHGIIKDDLTLALDRHATSKIICENDLFNIKTLGFRGEGLAAISAVSTVSLYSKIEDESHGYSIKSKFGSITNTKPIAMNNGTIIEITELFHNIPARKKFLKSENTEYLHCRTVFERLAISNPKIHFELYNNNKLIYKLEEADLLSRIKDIFGESYSKCPFIINDNNNPIIKIKGYVFHPSYLENKKNLQMIFINGRYVKDKIIYDAIKKGFNGVLHHDHNPEYVLFIDIDNKEVDFNVHPSKNEVRFVDNSLIHSFISTIIRKSLATTTPNDLMITKNTVENYYQVETPVFNNIKHENINYTNTSFYDDKTSINLSNLFTDNYSYEKPVFSLGVAIAQLNGIFILAQNEFGLVVVDMHAAHERVLLEDLKLQIKNKNIDIQNLLIPFIININDNYSNILNSHTGKIRELGFLIELNGNVLRILGVPKILENVNIEKLFLSLLDELEQYGHSNLIANQLDSILSKISCHLAVRANHNLSIEEMNSLLRGMEKCERSNYCNHGRPTWFTISMQELNSMFMRGK